MMVLNLLIPLIKIYSKIRSYPLFDRDRRQSLNSPNLTTVNRRRDIYTKAAKRWLNTVQIKKQCLIKELQ